MALKVKKDLDCHWPLSYDSAVIIVEKLTGLFVWVALLACFSSGCSNDNPPDGIVPMDIFAEIYAAMVENERLAGPEALLNTRLYNADTTLARFGVTRDQIQATIDYYDRDLRRWHEFYVEAMQRIEWGPGKKNLDKAKGKDPKQ